MKNILFINLTCLPILIVLFLINPILGMFFIAFYGGLQILLSIVISLSSKSVKTRNHALIHLSVSLLVLVSFFISSESGLEFLIWLAVSICFMLFVYSFLIGYLNFKDYEYTKEFHIN
jgi:hypothetical protein